MQVTGNNHNNHSRISIQVGLGGYSFIVSSGDEISASDWQTPERIFVTPQMQKRYDEVEISVFTPKCALVPVQFYDPQSADQLLSEVVALDPGDVVEAVQVPWLASVLLYSNVTGDSLSKAISGMVLKTDGSSVKPVPEMYCMLDCLERLPEYNKIVVSYMDGYLYLVIAQGRTLLLCNAYKAVDFTTAQYFIFLAMKKLQLNPEMSSLYFRTPLTEDEEMSLYRYCKSVERI